MIDDDEHKTGLHDAIRITSSFSGWYYHYVEYLLFTCVMSRYFQASFTNSIKARMETHKIIEGHESQIDNS